MQEETEERNRDRRDRGVGLGQRTWAGTAADGTAGGSRTDETRGETGTDGTRGGTMTDETG